MTHLARSLRHPKLAASRFAPVVVASALAPALAMFALVPSDARAAGGERAAARSETQAYVAEIKATGTYAAGKEAVVEVAIEAKPGYHINAQYPFKLKAGDAPDGVTYPKPVLARADGTFDEHKGAFKLAFVAAKAGKYTVGGTLHLSVCNDASCLLDKVPLETTVDVK